MGLNQLHFDHFQTNASFASDTLLYENSCLQQQGYACALHAQAQPEVHWCQWWKYLYLSTVLKYMLLYM